MIQIWSRKLPNELGSVPIKWVSTAMFSLVRIWPMFEQEAPKWSRLDSDMIISRTKGKPDSDMIRFSLVISTTWQRKHINLFGSGKKDRGPALLLYHNIYMAERNMYTTRAGGSSVVRPKMSNIPWPAGPFLQRAWVLVVPNINKVMWPIIQILVDHKGSFPRWE